MNNINNIIANLKVDYKDENILLEDSPELDLINYFFDSITCGNKEVENLLWEVIGYSLTKTSKLCKAFIFKGEGRNGKSCIFRILEALLGDEQCSHEHLENLSGSKAGSKSTVRFLDGCTVNIAEDQKQPRYVNTSLITRIISGEPISVEIKGKEEFILKPYATMLFSVNEVIDFKETGIYITDRFVVIPFEATFTDKNNNRNIDISEMLCKPKALQIIATKAIKAFEQVLKNGRFTIPEVVERETRNYYRECNNIEEFCSLYPIKKFVIKSAYFNQYRKWCEYNNKEAVCNTKFGKEVLALGYKAERYSFNNDRKTYYSAPKFDNNESQTIYKEYLKFVGISEETARKYDDKTLLETFGVISFDEYLCNLLYDENQDSK